MGSTVVKTDLKLGLCLYLQEIVRCIETCETVLPVTN